MDAESTGLVRALVKDIDWVCEITTFFPESNLGCDEGVASAISWVLRHEECVIIVEDDILPSNACFEFLDWGLRNWATDSSVGAISACNLVPSEHLQNCSAVRISKYGNSWGWATWRRAWTNYSITMHDAGTLRLARDLYHVLRSPRLTFYWWFHTELSRRGVLKTWDYQWYATLLVNRLGVIYPPINLVANMGFRSDATHSVHQPEYWTGKQNHNVDLKVLELARQVAPQLDKEADQWVERNVYRLPLKRMWEHYRIRWSR